MAGKHQLGYFIGALLAVGAGILAQESTLFDVEIQRRCDPVRADDISRVLVELHNHPRALPNVGPFELPKEYVPKIARLASSLAAAPEIDWEAREVGVITILTGRKARYLIIYDPPRGGAAKFSYCGILSTSPDTGDGLTTALEMDQWLRRIYEKETGLLATKPRDRDN